ncbi:MAG: PQQ-binding-like beta-propeller repeat protein [Hyphomicrobium sp.]|nr:PQQ-binding-like beta-propeller repeat protein [Hyphomicrobium sp.]
MARNPFRTVLASAMVAALAWAQGAAAGEIDEARLSAARLEAESWLHHGRDLTGQRFSPLDQVSRTTVGKLVPKWIYQTGAAATFQTTPLVADGIMFLTAPFSHVMAVDAATGREIWRYEHKRPKDSKLCCGPANRGAALGYGKVFVATVDARLVALDQKSGAVVWDIPMAVADGGPTEDKAQLDAGNPALKGTVTGSTGVGAASAPLVIDGKVIAGITGVGYGLHLDSDRPGAPLGTVVGIAGRYGRPGFLAAYDAATGRKLWQFDTTQAGWEGAMRAETAYGVKLPRDIATETADLPKHRDAWRFGGGSVWHSPVADIERGLIYLGIGNPSPQAAGESRPGDNLYTSSLVALDIATGKIRWHYQQVPHDLWGYDVASPPALFDLLHDGTSIPAIGQASKLGWYFVHDRRDGKLLTRSEAFVPQDNLFAAPTREGIVISPGVGGGSNWSPAAVDPARGLAFVAAMHLPTRYQTAELPASDGKPAVTYYTFEPAKGPSWGLLSAIELGSGTLRWQVKTDEPLVGGTLATAGGLVFNGEGNGTFSAHDAETGARLWSFNCGAGVNAPPVSYAVRGKQFIAVAAGGSQIWGFRQGGALIAFGLPD